MAPAIAPTNPVDKVSPSFTPPSFRLFRPDIASGNVVTRVVKESRDEPNMLATPPCSPCCSPANAPAAVLIATPACFALVLSFFSSSAFFLVRAFPFSCVLPRSSCDFL